MTWHEKSELIQSDPVTCARHFDYMIRRFLNDILYSSYHPIGEVIDHFYRVEFQQRGSPHIHMSTWIKGAPQCGKDMNEGIASFVDQYATSQQTPSIIPRVYNPIIMPKPVRRKGKGFADLGFRSHRCQAL